ncbi:uncharacterized protein LOC111027857 isoform X2 [Myzus persicae]|uniref:uncharacterized protein LOC111027857 isoform X2 n=1 Tax=Myzus persicae TaxID=13164 RepID=UPI000B9362D3|nr:uncharacterized protein LOC111027857 isoform X2 [Myzus persicae]
MFELEDFDLDDEVFLNTQMPPFVGTSPIKSSNSNLVTSNFEDDDEIFLNVSNSVFELESSHSEDIKVKNKITGEQNKNNDNSQNMLETQSKSGITKPFDESLQNTKKLNFDDDFDSDDESFFNTSHVIQSTWSSLKNNVGTAKFDYNDDHNEVSIVNSEICEIKSSNIKSFNKSNCNSYLNTTITSVKMMTPKGTSRKFPGPAGLLSENEDLYSEDPSNLESLDRSINISENDNKEENLCIQASDSSFSSSPYQQFLSDFFTTDIDILLDKFNVAWIKQKLLPYTASGRFFTDKIPFFVSVLKEIDCLSPDPTVLLADKTGFIRGTIHRAVWNQFSCQLKLGAVLVLSNVGVSCQKILKGFTLNITSDHLVAIYSYSSDVQEVIVTRTTDMTNEEIVNGAKQWNAFNVEASNKNSHSVILKSRMNPLNNLKLHNILTDHSSQPSNANYQITNNTHGQSTPVKILFKPKTSIAHNLFKSVPTVSNNFPEEPPTKRTRNEFKTEDQYSNNDTSIIQNIFEGIDEDEMFNDFCC